MKKKSDFEGEKEINEFTIKKTHNILYMYTVLHFWNTLFIDDASLLILQSLA